MDGMGIHTKDGLCELSLFSGAGGGLLATKWLLGWRTVCYVEWEKYCIEVIKARIRDGLLDDAPIWDDAQTFDGRPWRGLVDVITAGFPCQPFSVAGRRRGKDDSRNMWPATIRIIRQVRPPFVFLENVPALRCPRRTKADPPTTEASYFGRILGDLAESGYDVRWKVLSAAEVGAPHKRDRVFAIATNAECLGWEAGARDRVRSIKSTSGESQSGNLLPEGPWCEIESLAERGTNGYPYRVDRLKAIGNGQVPLVVSTVWQLLTGDWFIGK